MQRLSTYVSVNSHVWKLMNYSPVNVLSLYFVLCTGETGIGKSTLMNTLFNTMFENEEASHYQNGVYLRPRTYDLQESNVHLKLTIVDTVGFGDQINKEDRWAGWNDKDAKTVTWLDGCPTFLHIVTLWHYSWLCGLSTAAHRRAAV